MRQFIILTGASGSDIAVDIKDIVSIRRENGKTLVACQQGGNSWYVRDSVAEIVKRRPLC